MSLSLPRRVETDRDVWQAFRYHSRTFSTAARLLPRAVRQPVATLYLFCRTIDNVADQRVLEVGAGQALDEVRRLRDQLDATLDGRPPDAFMWERLAHVHRRFGLSPAPLYELLDGAAWDLTRRPIETHQDLIEYSNLVGGSVGAMMLPFLVSDRAALARAEAPARALGIAMQITNIVRDVGEDRRCLDRVYLPRSILRAHGLSYRDLDGPALPEAYPALLESIMELAESLFLKGMAGIDLLSAQVRPGIRAAARMYREIMNEVRAHGYDNLRHRAYVQWWRKGALVLQDGYSRRKHRLRTARPVPVQPSLAQPA